MTKPEKIILTVADLEFIAGIRRLEYYNMLDKKYLLEMYVERILKSKDEMAKKEKDFYLSTQEEIEIYFAPIPPDDYVDPELTSRNSVKTMNFYELPESLKNKLKNVKISYDSIDNIKNIQKYGISFEELIDKDKK